MKNKKSKLICIVVTIFLLTALASTYAFAYLHEDDDWEYGTRTASDKKMCYSYFYCPEDIHDATARMYFLFWEDDDYDQKGAGEWAEAETGYNPIFWSTEVFYSH